MGDEPSVVARIRPTLSTAQRSNRKKSRLAWGANNFMVHQGIKRWRFALSSPAKPPYKTCTRRALGVWKTCPSTCSILPTRPWTAFVHLVTDKRGEKTPAARVTPDEHC